MSDETFIQYRIGYGKGHYTPWYSRRPSAETLNDWRQEFIHAWIEQRELAVVSDPERIED